MTQGDTGCCDEESIPSLEDMRDTLIFVWDTFFGQMIDSWSNDPGAQLETEYNNAAIRMRYRAISMPGGKYADLVELSITDQNGGFTATASFVAERSGEENVKPVQWSTEGDYEEFVAWMVPWVARHVAEGGGWIELP